LDERVIRFRNFSHNVFLRCWQHFSSGLDHLPFPGLEGASCFGFEVFSGVLEHGLAVVAFEAADPAGKGNEVSLRDFFLISG
jgi:hypothetical protein